MRYEDFTIRITSGGGGNYRVFVSSPSMGSTESAITLPYALRDLPGLVAGVALDVRRAETEVTSRNVVARTPAATVSRDASDVGVQLYAALFQGTLKEMLDGSLARLLGESEKGLRIRLEMNLRGEGMQGVASLPWELMRPHASELPLAVSSQTALVRVLDVERPTDPATFTRPLTVLVIISNPTGTEPLDLAEEEKRIRESWGMLDEVDVHFVKPQVGAINDICAEHDFHVIHYMGHGGFDAATGRGVLYLENPDGTPDALDSARLKAIFKEESNNLRLVFLNACKTAVSTDRDELDPFAGIAATLIELGVPAVVAMQFPITDDAAVMFADTFYRRIVEGHAVDAAVAGGRLQLYTAGKTRAEWATPVLFMRSKHGKLFFEEEAPPEAGAKRLALVAAPTLALLALLVGANYWRVDTDVTLAIVAGKVAFDAGGENAHQLLDRALPFSELRVEDCAAMEFVAASLQARAPVERDFQWTPTRHVVKFECFPGSAISLRSDPDRSRGVGSLPQVRVDPGANVVLSVTGGSKPVLAMDVISAGAPAGGAPPGQQFTLHVSGEFEIETDLTDLSGPDVPADAALALRSGRSTYVARLQDGRSIELRTAERTALVVTPSLEQTTFTPVALTEAGSARLPVRHLLFSGIEPLTDLPTALIGGALSYTKFTGAPAQDLAGKHVVLGPDTELEIRDLAVGERGLTLTAAGRIVGPSGGLVMDGGVKRDARLTVLQRLYYGLGWMASAAAAGALWLAATLAIWWAVNRRVRRPD